MPKGICTVPDCGKPMYARRVCRIHYRRLMRYGSADYARPSEAQRFWAKVDKTETCWIWTGSRDVYGYGRFRQADGSRILAHRYVMAATQDIAELEVDHMCHNTSCVRLDHLQAVSHQANTENRRGADRDSSTGVRGVTLESKRGVYRVQVMAQGRAYFGGRYRSIEDAEAAAIALRLRLHTNNLADRVA